MDQSKLTTEEFENAISTLIASASAKPSSGTSFEDGIFDKITNLLACVGREEWSLRPRTYVLLRMINRPDYMHQFVHNGLRDINLPYDNLRLPGFLDDASRHMFMETQPAVLTKANDLELENGRHRHFATNADCYFHIVGTLGSGKFGIVDHVQSKLSIARYARKRIYRARAAIKSKAATKSLENELETLKRLRHRHLVTYIGSYTDPQYVGILTIPVADSDLQRFLQRTPFPANDLALLRQFFGCLTSAVQYLHENKCRHKDIKPGNILVKDGQVYVTDFGTARDWSDREKGTTTGPSGPYTPRFAAPEVADWEPRNETADIWSLGVVFLDMLTVIKGKTVDEMTEFFEQTGTGGKSPRNNRESLKLWLDQLQETSQDNAPIRWILQMLNLIRSHRPSAKLLLEMILEHEDEHTYYGHCCSNVGEFDLASTYAGSEFEEPTLQIPSISIDTPLTPDLDSTEVPTAPSLPTINISASEDLSPTFTFAEGDSPAKETFREASPTSAIRHFRKRDEDSSAGEQSNSLDADFALPAKTPMISPSSRSNYQRPSVSDGTEDFAEIPREYDLKPLEELFPNSPKDQGIQERTRSPTPADMEDDILLDVSGAEDQTAMFAPEAKSTLKTEKMQLQRSPMDAFQIHNLYGNMLDLVHVAHVKICALMGADNANDVLDDITVERETLILKYRFREIPNDHHHEYFFVVLGHTFNTHSLCWWICSEVKRSFGAGSLELAVAGKLWQFLLDLEFRLIVLFRQSITLERQKEVRNPSEFYRSGREIWSRLESLLRSCEVEALGDFPRLLDSHANLDLTKHNSELARSSSRRFVDTLVALQHFALEAIILQMQDWSDEFTAAYGMHLGGSFSDPVEKMLELTKRSCQYHSADFLISLYPQQWANAANAKTKRDEKRRRKSNSSTGTDQPFSFSNAHEIFDEFFKSEVLDETDNGCLFGAISPPPPPPSEQQSYNIRLTPEPQANRNADSTHNRDDQWSTTGQVGSNRHHAYTYPGQGYGTTGYGGRYSPNGPRARSGAAPPVYPSDGWLRDGAGYYILDRYGQRIPQVPGYL